MRRCPLNRCLSENDTWDYPECEEVPWSSWIPRLVPRYLGFPWSCLSENDTWDYREELSRPSLVSQFGVQENAVLKIDTEYIHISLIDRPTPNWLIYQQYMNIFWYREYIYTLLIGQPTPNWLIYQRYINILWYRYRVYLYIVDRLTNPLLVDLSIPISI